MLDEITKEIKENLPPNNQVTQIEFEGPEVAIYSSNPRVLVNDESIVKDLAKRIRKRIVIRSDPKVRMAKDETVYFIQNLVGETGEITTIDFEDNLGEVLIEANKPGVVIGKSGETLREIVSKTLWRPRVMRTPPIESRVIKTIRHLYQEHAEKRQLVLRLIGQRIHRPLLYRDDTIRVTALGGYSEVGRSCSLVQTGESKVLVDCGINVGSQSPKNSFPRFDLPEFSVESLDAVVVSHAHLDHCLPPETPIKMADGSWKPIKDIQLNDALLSFNWKTGKYQSAKCIEKTFTSGHKFSYEIRTPYLNIKSSPNHRFFVIENFELKEIEARDLKKAQLIPVEKTHCINRKNMQKQLFRQIEYAGNVKINSEIRNLLREIRLKKALTQAKVASDLGIQSNTISNIENRSKSVSFPVLQKLIAYYGLKWNEFGTKHDLLRLPTHLTKDLAQLVGYIQGDGCKDSNTMTFKIVEPDRTVVNYYVDLIKKIFGISPIIRTRSDTQMKTYSIELTNTYVCRFLEKNFETIFAKSRKIQVPAIIKNADEGIISHYIKGLFDAEGSISTNVKMYIFSKNLLKNLQVLLYRLGIHASMYVNGGTLNVNSPDSIRQFADSIGFTSSTKKRKLEQFLEEIPKETNYRLRDLVPISSRDVKVILRNVGYLKRKPNSPKIANLPSRILSIYRRKTGYLSKDGARDLVNILEDRFEYLEDLHYYINDNYHEVRQKLSITREQMSSSLGLKFWQIQYSEENQYEDDITQKVKQFLVQQLNQAKTIISDYIMKINYILSLDVEWQQIKRISKQKNDTQLIDLEVEKHHNFIANNIIVHNSGFVPYLYKFKYEGPVYCTRPTRDLMTMLQIDYLDVANKEGKVQPYDNRDIRETVLHTIVLEYGEVTDIAPDIRLTFHNAGHIAGSAIPHLHIGEGLYNMAFAQDMKFSSSNLLDNATCRFPRLETLFIESTYGKSNDILPSRSNCEKKLADIVNNTVERGGIILIPVLAVGRAQEVMIILEKLIRAKQIPQIPIYTDGMIQEATAITSCHPEFLSKGVRDRIFHVGQNPFLAEAFQQVTSNEERELIVQGDPCIIMATSGMLSGGPSVSYFKNLSNNPNNSLIFVSYQGKGTLGSKIQKGITEVQFVETGKTVMYHVAMQIHSISGFTGHSDRRELENYIRKVHPKPYRYIVFHGEESKANNFASWIYKTTHRESVSPVNGSSIRLK